jgi:large subunit ribosomal protein L10
MKATGLSRISKDMMIKEIEKELKSRDTFFIARHDAVSAANIDKLRAKLRATKTRYLVIKNTLGHRAFERANLKDLAGHIQGACGLVFSSGDAALSSKVLMDFAKENENFKVQVALLHGQVLSAERIKDLANLPSREVLLSRMVGGIQAPISGFVGVLAGTLRKLVNVVDAISKKKSQ